MRVCVLVLYLRFLKESQRRGAYDGQGVAVRPEVVVVGRRGGAPGTRGAVCARCEIGASSDAAAGWGRSGVAAAPAGASRAGVRVGGAMGAGAGALSHAGGTLTLTSGVRGGGVAGARSGGRAGWGRQRRQGAVAAACVCVDFFHIAGSYRSHGGETPTVAKEGP